jgi:hypothetical protein
VALFKDGGFVVVWNDTGGQKSSVHARFFSAAGFATSGEFRLLAPATGSSAVTSVVVDGDDSFLVAWDYTPVGRPKRVKVSRFDRTGRSLGPAFQVHADSPYARFGGHLALVPGGGFAVAWTGEEDHLTQLTDLLTFRAYDAYTRVFAANGFARGPEFLVASGFDDQTLADVAVGPDRVIHVLYTTYGEIYILTLARFSLAGQQLGDSTYVSDQGGNLPGSTGVLSLAPDGGFAVAWTHFDTGDNVWFRRFAADDTPLTGDKRVNSYIQGGQLVGDMAALPEGGFVLVWTDEKGRDGSGSGIFTRVVGPDGDPLLPRDLRVNPTTQGNQFSPVIAGRGGRFVAAWAQGATVQLPTQIRGRFLGE